MNCPGENSREEITVIEQPLEVTLPRRRVCMFFMQPYVDFETPHQEPYRWSRGSVDGQREAIHRTLELAKGAGAHFTVFPEYAIPGLEGVGVVDRALREADWPRDTIVIGGLDGLSSHEYQSLCEMSSARYAPRNAPTEVLAEEKWVNCCITWAKDRHGDVAKWIQPKLLPCEQERGTPCLSMFRGGVVYLFCGRFDNGMPYRFFTVVCFDWIASFDGQRAQAEILSQLDQEWAGGDPKAIHWAFLIQHNDKPNDAEFLRQTEDFLLEHDKYPAVDRHHACVVIANTAANRTPCRHGPGGFSSFVFEPNAPFIWHECRPTVSVNYKRYRENGGFTRCRDVTFREMGPCIQSGDVAVGQWVDTRKIDRCSAVDGGCVFALTATCSDPRLPDGEVPPAVKWLNDELDTIPSLADKDLRRCRLEETVRGRQAEAAREMRRLTPGTIEQRMLYAVCPDGGESKEHDQASRAGSDFWSEREKDGFEGMVHGLAVLGTCHRLCVSKSPLHGTLIADGSPMRIVIVSGPTHEMCRRHFDRYVGRSGADPVILVTRDERGLIPTPEESQRIDDVGEDTTIRCKDYKTLIRRCRNADTDKQLREANDDIFNPRDPRFI